MMPVMARREVTLREWAEEDGYTYSAARQWRQWYPDFPEKSRLVGTTALYFLADLRAWKRAHPTLGHGLGYNRKR
jgi:hypothetical protein